MSAPRATLVTMVPATFRDVIVIDEDDNGMPDLESSSSDHSATDTFVDLSDGAPQFMWLECIEGSYDDDPARDLRFIRIGPTAIDFSRALRYAEPHTAYLVPDDIMAPNRRNLLRLQERVREHADRLGIHQNRVVLSRHHHPDIIADVLAYQKAQSCLGGADGEDE